MVANPALGTGIEAGFEFGNGHPSGLAARRADSTKPGDRVIAFFRVLLRCGHCEDPVVGGASFISSKNAQLESWQVNLPSLAGQVANSGLCAFARGLHERNRLVG